MGGASKEEWVSTQVIPWNLLPILICKIKARVTGHIKGRWSWKLSERRSGGERGWSKESRAETQGLEKPQVVRGLIDGEHGSIVVDLPNLGPQLVFILIELCFHCQGIFGLEIYHNSSPANPFYKSYIYFRLEHGPSSAHLSNSWLLLKFWTPSLHFWGNSNKLLKRSQILIFSFFCSEDSGMGPKLP